jgi:hypothetical protein
MRHQTFVRTGWLNILFQVVLLVLLYIVEPFFQLKVEGNWGILVTSFPVLLPCAAWACSFYLTESQHPRGDQAKTTDCLVV